MKSPLLICAALLLAAAPARAYVEIPYTLGRVVQEATNIVVMEVVKVNPERRLIYYKKIADLKGKHNSDVINHQIQNGFHPREPKFIMDWAAPGKIAIFFHNGGASETCIGDYWYQAYPGSGPWWSMSHSEPFFAWCFSGKPEKLRDLIVEMLAGKEVVVPCSQFPDDRNKMGEWKNLMHEKKAPLWRLKASLKLQDYEAILRERKKYVVGLGALGPEAVPGFVSQLKSPDAKARLTAAEELGNIGSDAKAAVAPLTEVLNDGDWAVRIKAADALVKIDPAAPKAIDTLVAAIGQEAHRAAAVETLGGLGAAAKPAVGALAGVLKDNAPANRVKAADALFKIEPTHGEIVPTLSALLGDPAKEIKVKAAELLGNIGPAAKSAVAPLVKTMGDADGDVRVKAAEALGKMAPESVPALIDGLRDANAAVRSVCLDALAQCGGHTARAVPALIERLKDPEPGLRVKAAAVLRPFAGGQAAAVPTMMEFLKSPDRDTRLLGATILADVGPAAKDAIPLLIERVKGDTSGTVRMTSAVALGRIGNAAKAAAPAILAQLTDPLIAPRDMSYKIPFADAWGRVKDRETGPVAVLFEDDAPLFQAQLYEGDTGNWGGETRDKHSGAASFKVTPNQRYGTSISAWGFPIVEKPGPGQYRYIRFAWKKVGGDGIMIQLGQNGEWNRRYVSGRNVHNWQPSITIDPKVPRDWVVVTRDLYKDFGGPFTLTGIALAALDGNHALFDHMILGRTIEDLDKAAPRK